MGNLYTVDGVTGNIVTAGSISATGGIVGTATNDNAAAGNVGEYIESVVTSAFSFAASNTWSDMTSISLTAGDWDVTFMAVSEANVSTWSAVVIGISPNSGNSSSGLATGNNKLVEQFASSSTTPLALSCSIPNYRVSLASTTTYYAKILSVYSAGTPAISGRLVARRVR